MSLDMESVREQLEAKVRDRLAVEKCRTCGGYQGTVSAQYARHNDECSCVPCYNCKEPILKADYRITDDLGNSFDTFCWGDVRADMETDKEGG
jgi:hypothetical protein